MASLKAEYERKQQLSTKISKFANNKRNPIGVVSMVKNPAIKCDLDESLQALPLTSRAGCNSVTKNASIMVDPEKTDQNAVNIH